MSREIRAGPGALLKRTRPELGRSTEKDRSRVRVAHGPGHASDDRARNEGGISMVSKRYAKANNLRVEGYDPDQLTNYITYLDANNLYGWAMSRPLPKKNFHWKRVMPTKDQIMKMKCNSKKGRILEVDLEYPAHMHNAHNDYPLVPEKKVIKPEQMLEYQRRLMADLDLTMQKTEKLVLMLED